MRQPSLDEKCRILGDYWSQHREVLATDPAWSQFITQNQRGLVVAYALSQQLAHDPSQRAIDLIDETYVKFCDLLWLDAAYPFDSLDEALSYSQDSPVPVAESRRESALKPQRVISDSSFGTKGYLFGKPSPSSLGPSHSDSPKMRTKGPEVRHQVTPRWPGIVGVGAVAAVLMVAAFALITNSAREPVEVDKIPEPAFVADPNPADTVVPSTSGGGRSSGSSGRQGERAEADDSIRFNFQQQTEPSPQDDRPVSGRGSGCKVGVADGDRCVGVRPIPGPRGPIPQPFSIPRDPAPSPPAAQPSAGADSSQSDDSGSRTQPFGSLFGDRMNDSPESTDLDDADSSDTPGGDVSRWWE